MAQVIGLAPQALNLWLEGFQIVLDRLLMKERCQYWYPSIQQIHYIIEGPHIQLVLRNQAPKYHTIRGILGPNSLQAVYVESPGRILPLMAEILHDPYVPKP